MATVSAPKARTDPTASATKEDSEVLPFKPEKDWIDGGWCTIGEGEFQTQLRIFIDLGAKCSYASRQLYDILCPLIRKGNLGAARIANNVSRIAGNGWDGSNTKMSRWLELPIVCLLYTSPSPRDS